MTQAQIENELNGQWKSIPDKTLNPPVAGYMQALEDTARDNGIDVPLSHNAPNMVTLRLSPPTGAPPVLELTVLVERILLV